MKTKYITNAFYSNCFIEAMKAKIKDWHRVKITYIRPRYGESFFFVPHFMWSDGVHDYDFGIEKLLMPWEVFWFKGYIRMRSLGSNEKYKQMRIERWQRRKSKGMKNGSLNMKEVIGKLFST